MAGLAQTINKALSGALRGAGAAFETLGRTLEVNPHVDKLIPSTRVVSYKKATPEIRGAFVASDATVVGKVQIGSSSSVWYGAVIRGDVNTIDIGENVTVGDRAMIHCSGIGANKPTKIGNNVVIGAGAIVHGCTLQDECYVGQGAQILDGATVSKNAMVSAGSVLGQGKVVPSGQLWSGIPAIYKRDLTQAEIASISAQAKDNVEWALLHAKESSKNWETIESECEDYEQTINRNESYYKRLSAEAIAFKLGELDNNNAVPGRVLDSGVSARIDPDPRPRA